MFVTTGKLSTDVRKPDSTIGCFLRETFPNLKPFQVGYNAASGALIVEGKRATAGTIGTALDLTVRLLVEPDEVPVAAVMMHSVQRVLS